MTPAPRSTLRWALRVGRPLALAILAGSVPLGCYKPHIKDGGLRCNLDAGTGNACPEGFRCDTSKAPPTCWRNLDGGVDRPFDAPDGSVDMQMTETKPETAVCFDARPGCAPRDGGLCDPYCQTGCACGTKCSINTIGNLTCNPPSAIQFPRAVMQDCNEVIASGSPDQTDNCGPGLVCINEGCPFPRCFQFCRTDADCPASACTRDVGGLTSGQKVCEVPFADSCVPLPSALNTGCGPVTSGMACYISSASPTHTICDCPYNALPANSACTRSRECIRGLACVDKGDGSMPKCLQVCKLSNDGSDCPSGTPGSCRPYTGIPFGQQPHPTFGFCN